MLQVIIRENAASFRYGSFVSISGKFQRLLLFKEAYGLMKLNSGGHFSYIQFCTGLKKPGIFWMRPCEQDSPGSVRIVTNRQNGSLTIAAGHLLTSIGWDSLETVRCPLTWDEGNRAGMVVLSRPVECGSTAAQGDVGIEHS